MNKAQTIFTCIYLVFVVFVFWALFHTRTIHGTTVKINVSIGELVTIDGPEQVSIYAEDDEYFRIYAGETRLLAEPDNQDNFFAQADKFPTRHWEIKEGDGVDVTLESNYLMVVKVEQSLETIVAGGFLLIVLFLLLWLFINFGLLE